MSDFTGHLYNILALFPFPTLLLFLVCIFLFVCPSACLCVCVCLCVSVFVCASVCLYVFMYYVYMQVVFIVINVCKLLHVRKPTSSPRAVWNPCKLKKSIELKIYWLHLCQNCSDNLL